MISDNVINSGNDLMMDKFIICVCDNDLSVLVKSGNVGRKELEKAWGLIYSEYIEALKDKEQLNLFQTVQDIHLLSFKIEQINMCMMYLSIDFNAEILKELKKLLPVTGKFNFSDKEQYKKDLLMVSSQGKRFLVELQTKKKDLEQFNIGKAVTKIDRLYFTELFVQLSKHMKFQIVKSTTSCIEFASMIADLKKLNEQLNAQQNGKR